MTPHIEAPQGSYADTVLLPGDPLRAKWIAETFLTEVKCVNKVRNCLGFTGMYQDKKISVQGGGMGMPSNAIYITELYEKYNVEKIIRVGSCGGIAEHVKVGDVVLATSASTDSNMGQALWPGKTFCPSYTQALGQKFIDALPNLVVGPIMSSDWFYNPDNNWVKHAQQLGVIAVEMETYALYGLANKFKKQALSVNTVSDHLVKTGNNMTPEQREKGFTKMVEAVLKI